jgi:hypothetical protein
VQLSTVNGSVHAELPPTTEGSFDLATTNGTVQSDVPLAAASGGRGSRHLSGQVGTATRSVRLHTTNGRVVLTARSGSAMQH